MNKLKKMMADAAKRPSSNIQTNPLLLRIPRVEGEPILIIGNKPYTQISLDKIIDSFNINYRLNLSLPNNNNGTKYGHLGVCSHLRDNLLSHTPGPAFIHKYKSSYKEDYLREYVDLWNSEANSSFISKFFVNPDKGAYHSYLKRAGSPYRFEKQPRTGISLIFNELIKATHKIFITNFSIQKEERVSHYVKPGKYESDCHGSADSEVAILKWLHVNGKIDASLCLLEDYSPATLQCGGITPSQVVVDLIASQMGGCVVKD